MRFVPRRGLGRLLLWLHATPSSALGSAPEPTVPYRAWPEARFETPRAPLPARGPAPEAESPELARRALELELEFALGVPHCASQAAEGCPLLEFGGEIAVTVLGRPSPYLSLGGSLRRFVFEPGSSGDADAARATQIFFGFDARAYFLERGRFDPYLELGLGGGPLTGASRGGHGTVEDKVSFAAGARSAAGVDLWVGDWLRLGAFLAVTRYFPSSAARCDALGCSGLRASSTQLAIGATSLGLRLTLVTGEAL